MPLSSQKKSIPPDALRASIMAEIITPLGMRATDESFVEAEFRWLFSAIANFQALGQVAQQQLVEARATIKQRIDEEERQQIAQLGSFGRYPVGRKDRLVDEALEQRKSQLWQAVLANSPSIKEPIPPEAIRQSEKDNRILSTSMIISLEIWLQKVEATLTLINADLSRLHQALDREIKMGEEGKRNVTLQNSLKSYRLTIVKYIADLADVINQAYGILVDSPRQLVELIGAGQ